MVLGLEICPDIETNLTTPTQIFFLSKTYWWKFSCESFCFVALFKTSTEERLRISAPVKLKLCILDWFHPMILLYTCMKRLIHTQSVLPIYQSIQTSHLPCKPGSKFLSSFSTCQGWFILVNRKLMITRRWSENLKFYVNYRTEKLYYVI